MREQWAGALVATALPVPLTTRQVGLAGAVVVARLRWQGAQVAMERFMVAVAVVAVEAPMVTTPAQAETGLTAS